MTNKFQYIVEFVSQIKGIPDNKTFGKYLSEFLEKTEIRNNQVIQNARLDDGALRNLLAGRSYDGDNDDKIRIYNFYSNHITKIQKLSACTDYFYSRCTNEECPYRHIIKDSPNTGVHEAIKSYKDKIVKNNTRVLLLLDNDCAKILADEIVLKNKSEGVFLMVICGPFSDTSKDLGTYPWISYYVTNNAVDNSADVAIVQLGLELNFALSPEVIFHYVTADKFGLSASIHMGNYRTSYFCSINNINLDKFLDNIMDINPYTIPGVRLVKEILPKMPRALPEKQFKPEKRYKEYRR